MIKILDLIECNTFLFSQVVHEKLGDHYHAPHAVRLRVEQYLPNVLFPGAAVFLHFFFSDDEIVSEIASNELNYSASIHYSTYFIAYVQPKV